MVWQHFLEGREEKRKKKEKDFCFRAEPEIELKEEEWKKWSQAGNVRSDCFVLLWKCVWNFFSSSPFWPKRWLPYFSPKLLLSVSVSISFSVLCCLPAKNVTFLFILCVLMGAAALLAADTHTHTHTHTLCFLCHHFLPPPPSFSVHLVVILE